MKLFLSLGLLSLSLNCNAYTKIEYCNAIRSVAEQVMDLRVSGVSRDKVESASNDEVFKILVKAAWEFNLKSGDEWKEISISSFGRDAYTACMAAKELNK